MKYVYGEEQVLWDKDTLLIDHNIKYLCQNGEEIEISGLWLTSNKLSFKFIIQRFLRNEISNIDIYLDEITEKEIVEDSGTMIFSFKTQDNIYNFTHYEDNYVLTEIKKLFNIIDIITKKSIKSDDVLWDGDSIRDGYSIRLIDNTTNSNLKIKYFRLVKDSVCFDCVKKLSFMKKIIIPVKIPFGNILSIEKQYDEEKAIAELNIVTDFVEIDKQLPEIDISELESKTNWDFQISDAYDFDIDAFMALYELARECLENEYNENVKVEQNVASESENIVENNIEIEEDDEEKTVLDIYNELTEEQKDAVNTIIGLAIENKVEIIEEAEDDENDDWDVEDCEDDDDENYDEQVNETNIIIEDCDNIEGLKVDEEYFCTRCGAILNYQYGFDPNDSTWTCTKCGQRLMDEEVYDGNKYVGIEWHCDGCNALLNKQNGFSDICGIWLCSECGRINKISETEIIDDKTNESLEKINTFNKEQQQQISQKQIYNCPKCGDILNNQWGYNEHLKNWTCKKCNSSLFHNNHTDVYTVEKENKWGFFSGNSSNAVRMVQDKKQEKYQKNNDKGFLSSISDYFSNFFSRETVKKEKRKSLNTQKLTKFLICVFGGFFGVHKFMEGKFGVGLLYLFTFGLFGIGWIVDTIKYLFTIFE